MSELPTLEELLELGRKLRPGNALRCYTEEIDRLNTELDARDQRIAELEDRVMEYGDEQYWEGYEHGADAAREEMSE